MIVARLAAAWPCLPPAAPHQPTAAGSRFRLAAGPGPGDHPSQMMPLTCGFMIPGRRRDLMWSWRLPRVAGVCDG